MCNFPPATGRGEVPTDASAPTRDLLHAVYYAQKAYQKKQGKFARAASELGKEFEKLNITLETTRSSFDASIDVPGNPKTRRWTISQDSRIWSEELP